LATDFKPELKEVKDPNVSNESIASKRRDIENLESKKIRHAASLSELNMIFKDLHMDDPSDAIKLTNCLAYLKASKLLEEETSRLATIKQDAGLNATEEVKQDPEEIKKLQSEQEGLSDERSKLINSASETERYKKARAELHTCISKLGDQSSVDLKARIEALSLKIKESTETRQMCIKLAKRRELVDSHSSIKKQLEMLSEKAGVISNLLENAKQVELRVLESSVGHLNFELKRYLDVMFVEEPITIQFKTVRESKSNADHKTMTCSVTCFYKNHEYPSVSQLSGGEGDRVSLAMMLALNNLTGSTIILLDETMHGMDRTAKLHVVELLKMVTGDSMTCIVVAHEGVEGVYDASISL
jgi:ABC-type lipoprotein export system ATPase subunit